MINLPKEAEKELIASIRRFFAEILEDEVGELKARLVLDYCVREIGPRIYNQAIADAQAHLHDKVNDLDSSLYEPELSYWKK